MPETQTIIGKEFPQKVIPLIRRAKNSIDIVVYNWYWYSNQIGSEIQKFNSAIVVAARRGVSVRVITESNTIINVLLQNKIKARKMDSPRTLHAKLMIIDDAIAIFGSHNYTEKAFVLNYEISIATQDKEIVNRLKIFFKNLWL